MIRLPAACLGLIALLGAGPAPQQPAERPAPRPLLCYSGPSMRASMEELARRYETKSGTKVVVETNDPRTLIDRIVLAPTADLFISHDPFLAILSKQEVPVRRSWTIASLVPVIAVAKGNPRGIRDLDDLARPGLKVGLTDRARTISGHIVDVMVRKAGLGDRVEANVVTRAGAGRELAAMLADGKIDAGIVWNAVAFANRDRMEAVAIRPEWRPRRGDDAEVDSPTLGRLELDYVRVTIAQLGTSPNPDAARAFAEYVASPEGVAVFRGNGFSPADPERPSPVAPAPR